MRLFDMQKKLRLPNEETALPGREEVMNITNHHFVLGEPIKAPFPEGCETVVLGMGCFWGVERLFWELDGVLTTAVGYSAGITKNPSYKEVCSGQTGHNEVVLIVFKTDVISFDRILEIFWTSHNPTQGMRQANDIGTQYRSGIYCSSEAQLKLALESKERYQNEIRKRADIELTTEIAMAAEFYYAEDYHQQYLAKNPGGYCNLQVAAKTGLPCWPQD